MTLPTPAPGVANASAHQTSTGASRPLLGGHALSVGWGQQVIVGPVDLTLQRGEILGLTGPNGVGKSTLLGALAGSAQCMGGTLEKAPGLRIALQTQQTPPVMGLPLNGHELLRLTHAPPDGLPPWLAHKLDWRLDRLSGGQRQYLALWAILQTPADVILLDEPTNNLDEAGCQHLAGAIRSRAASGVGIVLVSHDADFVVTVCDRTLALHSPTAQEKR